MFSFQILMFVWQKCRWPSAVCFVCLKREKGPWTFAYLEIAVGSTSHLIGPLLSLITSFSNLGGIEVFQPRIYSLYYRNSYSVT